MNIYFCGIGGVGIGPLAEIAFDAGHNVWGSDKNEGMVTKLLEARGISVSYDQSGDNLRAINEQHPIDWFVYTAGITEEHPELVTALSMGIRTSKRDELLSEIVEQKGLKLIGITGTHGKTTTTAMMIWTLKQLGIPISYSVGATMQFGPSGHFDPDSEYFVYECDEFDRNFLKFHPYLSIITSIDYDHPDIYDSSEDYTRAFRKFIDQSAWTILWRSDADKVGDVKNGWVLGNHDSADIRLAGQHNRDNASQVIKAIERLGIKGDAVTAINKFPGANRRFEKLANNLYTDYGHHPIEVEATLQMAKEVAEKVVLVYQPHQNVRQHELRSHYTNCFEQADKIYWLPTYLTREDPELPVLTPSDLIENVTNKDDVIISELDDNLWRQIQSEIDNGSLVLVMGAGSIDDWVRKELRQKA